MTLLTKTFLIPLFSLDPVDRHVEQPVEHAVGHHALPRDLGRQGARRQVAVEALAILRRPLRLQIHNTGNFLHILEGKTNRTTPALNFIFTAICNSHCGSAGPVQHVADKAHLQLTH